MKKVFALMIVAGAVALASCKSETKTEGEVVDTTTTPAVDTTAAAVSTDTTAAAADTTKAAEAAPAAH